MVDENRTLLGVITRNALQKFGRAGGVPAEPLSELANRDPVVAYAGEPLRVVVNRMAQSGLTRFPVVERWDSRKLVGMVSLNDYLLSISDSMRCFRQGQLDSYLLMIVKEPTIKRAKRVAKATILLWLRSN